MMSQRTNTSSIFKNQRVRDVNNYFQPGNAVKIAHSVVILIVRHQSCASTDSKYNCCERSRELATAQGAIRKPTTPNTTQYMLIVARANRSRHVTLFLLASLLRWVALFRWIQVSERDTKPDTRRDTRLDTRRDTRQNNGTRHATML